MEPLHVTARMTEPVVYYGDGMHLDGPLAYACYCDLARGAREAVPPIGSEWAVDFGLPLARWEIEAETAGHVDDRLFIEPPIVADGKKRGTIWGWKASAVHADWLCHNRHSVRRKPDTDAMSRYTSSPSVNLGAGQQKATDIALPAMFAAELHWYAVGDAAEVARLLTHYVRAVGKLSSQGPGRVAAWTVEPWKHDWSMTRDGRATRNLPMGFVADGFLAEAAIRPPYHHRSRHVLAIQPEYEELKP